MPDSLDLLLEWRQGDLFLGPMEIPLIGLEDGREVWSALIAPDGVAVISQSCDIVRDVAIRPYIQIAALVQASDNDMGRSIRMETPSRIYLEVLADRNLLVDLDATATVHKNVIRRWTRTCGISSDRERRRFSHALARYKGRFAFPDEFNVCVQPIRSWIVEKRKKQNTQGEFVRSLQEFRVACDNWDSPEEIVFFGYLNEKPSNEVYVQWCEYMKKLEDKFNRNSIYPAAEFILTTYDDISARDYVASDRLDWDGLSQTPNGDNSS